MQAGYAIAIEEKLTHLESEMAMLKMDVENNKMANNAFMTVIATHEFPNPSIGNKFWSEIYAMFRTNRRMEEQFYSAIVQSAFSGTISHTALYYALTQRNFILFNPVPRLLIQCAMLGPFDSIYAMRFAIFISQRMAEEWEESIRWELENLMLKAMTWKCRPEILFPKAVKEYTKRDPSDVPPFDAFWQNIEPIIEDLKSKQLIDADRIDNFDPELELSNFDREERANYNRRAQFSDDEVPEYTNLDPVSPNPIYLEAMAQIKATADRENFIRQKRRKGIHGRKKNRRNRSNFWSTPPPMDSDAEPEYSNLDPVEPNPVYLEAIRNFRERFNGNGFDNIGNGQGTSSATNDYDRDRIPSLLSLQIQH